LSHWPAPTPFLRTCKRSPCGIMGRASVHHCPPTGPMKGARMVVSSPSSAETLDRNAPLAVADPDVAEAIRLEADRQRDNLELIASENYVSRAVLEAAGTVLTNKYAEGLPGRRYYGGCDY